MYNPVIELGAEIDQEPRLTEPEASGWWRPAVTAHVEPVGSEPLVVDDYVRPRFVALDTPARTVDLVDGGLPEITETGSARAHVLPAELRASDPEPVPAPAFPAVMPNDEPAWGTVASIAWKEARGIVVSDNERAAAGVDNWGTPASLEYKRAARGIPISTNELDVADPEPAWGTLAHIEWLKKRGTEPSQNELDVAGVGVPMVVRQEPVKLLPTPNLEKPALLAPSVNQPPQGNGVTEPVKVVLPKGKTNWPVIAGVAVAIGAAIWLSRQ